MSTTPILPPDMYPSEEDEANLNKVKAFLENRSEEEIAKILHFPDNENENQDEIDHTSIHSFFVELEEKISAKDREKDIDVKDKHRELMSLIDSGENLSSESTENCMHCFSKEEKEDRWIVSIHNLLLLSMNRHQMNTDNVPITTVIVRFVFIVYYSMYIEHDGLITKKYLKTVRKWLLGWAINYLRGSFRYRESGDTEPVKRMRVWQEQYVAWYIYLGATLPKEWDDVEHREAFWLAKYYHRLSDISRSNKTMIEFLQKHCKCKCLKNLSKQSKTLGKLYFCANCKIDLPKTDAVTCERCQIDMYCSKLCQRERWKQCHRYCCNTWTTMKAIEGRNQS